MVVIQLAGGSLNHIGNAMQPTSEAALRGVQLLGQQQQRQRQVEFAAARNQILRKNADMREAEFQLGRQREQAKQMRAQMQDLQKGLENVAPAVTELGYDYDMSGLQSAFMQMGRYPGGEAIQRRLLEGLPMPQSEQDPAFPLFYNAVASAIPSLYERDERVFADAQRQAFQRDMPHFGFREDDVAGLTALFDREDAPDKETLREAMDLAYQHADDDRMLRVRTEFFKKKAQSMVGPDDDLGPEETAAYGRLVEGTSKNPGQDMLKLTISKGGKEVREAFQETLTLAAQMGALSPRHRGPERTRADYSDPTAPQPMPGQQAAPAAPEEAREEEYPSMQEQMDQGGVAPVTPEAPAGFDPRGGDVAMAMMLNGNDPDNPVVIATRMYAEGLDPTDKDAVIQFRRDARAKAAIQEEDATMRARMRNDRSTSNPMNWR